MVRRAGPAMLRIGCVKYLNARPLINGWKGSVDFDHPSALCTKLAAGELDVALVSSFEFLRNPIYRIVDDVSISSDGPVYSVFVASRTDLAESEEIELDPASETSANLLRCLLVERGLNLRLVQHSTAASPAADLRAARRPQLLIGDQAIRFRQKYAEEFLFWDLGEQWRKLVGLPFVYALWLVRPEVTDPEPIANRLRALRDENLADLDHVIEDVVAGSDAVAQREPANREFLWRYYREHLRFGFGKTEKEGLRVFADLCKRRSLLLKRELAFPVV